MPKPHTLKCAVCGTIEKSNTTHGRIINGKWDEDSKIIRLFWGRWVCSNTCYRKLTSMSEDEQRQLYTNNKKKKDNSQVE